MSPTAAPAGDIPSLNGIRALAVMLVFLAHAGLENLVPGGLGVTMFFVLSGYLITTLMLIEYRQRGQVDLGAFYLRRMLRLMPPLALVLLTTWLLGAAGWIDGSYTPAGFLSVLFYFGNYYVIAHDFNGVPAGIGVVWSLAVEEHYYLLYPWLALPLLQMRRPQLSAAMLGALCVAVLGWRYWLATRGAPEAHLIMATDARLDAILYGCILALVANPWLAPPRQRSSRRDAVIAIACTLMLLGSLLERDPLFRVTLRYTLQCLAVSGLLYLAVARAADAPFRWLNLRPVVYVGTISYSIYLTHHVLLFAAARYLPATHPLIVAVIAALLTLTVAELMRRHVEEPCARLRRRLHHARTRPAPLQSSTQVTLQ
ncbi:MAG TPA: acyltransferase [Nevskiaceae bacterium]|nr:acyltransferase [Nevskiaceae bacterium]